ncbi:MAG: 23S rRNA (adenine(2503)-C(2))-methyltransferase RlmN [Rickettsiales bacterium]|nr:23S rRNA (adenine(2503)-C(2))-methyltransferase RlmN [Rickettsiales bacterium]
MSESLVLKQAEQAEPTGTIGERLNLIGLTQEEVSLRLEMVGIKRFRAKQLWHWLYKRGASSFDEMDNIAKDHLRTIADHFMIERADHVEDLLSEDGTRKWLFQFSDTNKVETVLIPEGRRGTLCISSQVGCTLSCTFCHTGTQRLVRNLTAGEIVGQVLASCDALGQWPTTDESKRKITNIVFMGMGEPLFNYEHVKKACEIMLDDKGLYLSRRKVTISTSGVVPKIYQMADELGVNLAISLHAVNDELRNEIVPINRKYPLAELIESLHYYHEKHPTRSILIEYVMLDGVNDSLEEAHQMAKLLKGLPVKINLIPFNPWPGSPYTCSSGNRIYKFAGVLQDYKLPAPIRTPRGQDILAACGQLKSDSELKKGQKVKLN